MIKIMILTLLISSLVSKTSFAQQVTDELKCSANGTVVLYVPDAMSIEAGVLKDSSTIRDILSLELNKNAIDLKSQSVDFLPLKSPGLSTAKLSYFLNSISDPTIRESAWMRIV